MLNILSIVPYNFLPSKMGGQKCIGSMHAYLGQLSRLTCTTTSSNDEACAKNYEVLKVFSERKLRYINPLYFFRLKKIIAQKNISHLVIEHPYYGWLGLLLQRFCKVKLIVHSHNIEALRFKSIGKWWWRILWYYEKWVHQNVTYSFFITDEDRSFAISRYGVNPQQCSTITYGIDNTTIPTAETKQAARKQLQQQYGIAEKDTVLLFNGTLSYKPNLDAVDVIISTLVPLLQQHQERSYKVIICGKGLPEDYIQKKGTLPGEVIIAGFVEDINTYFNGADMFINPVIDGGGIKTKIVEALGLNLAVVSTQSGAIGVPETITGGHLKTVADGDWNTFAQQVMAAPTQGAIPQAFFDHFYWGNIASLAATTLELNT